jgi:hypothetical protein
MIDDDGAAAIAMACRSMPSLEVLEYALPCSSSSMFSILTFSLSDNEIREFGAVSIARAIQTIPGLKCFRYFPTLKSF